MKKSSWSILACFFAAAGALTAQESKSEPAKQETKKRKPAELDTVAKQTLQAWAKKLSHPGRAGVRKIEFEIAVTSRGGMTGKWKALGAYAYDASDRVHPWGVLTWDDEEVAAAMERRGFTARLFSGDFQTDGTRGYAGAKITGAQKKNGTILTVRGGGRKEETFLLFDKAGVHIATMVGPMRKKLYYEPRKKQFVRSGETYSIAKSSGAVTMPATNGDLTVWHRDVDGFHVPVKIHEIVRVDGKLMSDLTLTLRKHKINAKQTKQPTIEPGKKAGKKPIQPPKK